MVLLCFKKLKTMMSFCFYNDAQMSMKTIIDNVIQLLSCATVWLQQTAAEKWGCCDPFRGGRSSPTLVGPCLLSMSICLSFRSSHSPMSYSHKSVPPTGNGAVRRHGTVHTTSVLVSSDYSQHSVAWSREAYLRTKWHLDPSSRLA